MDIQKDSFVFYRSFYNILKKMTIEEVMETIMGMCAYALDGEEPTFSQRTADISFDLVRPQLDANTRKYINGKKGGAPKGSQNNPNGRKGNTVPESIEILPEIPTTLETIPPSTEEVTQFFTENNMADQAEKFFQYNESRGWIVGGSPVRSWKAIAYNWMAKVKERNPNHGDPVLGVGEFRTADGHRTYGSGEIIVPETAEPRPGKAYWWNELSQQWDNAA